MGNIRDRHKEHGGWSLLKGGHRMGLFVNHTAGRALLFPSRGPKTLGSVPWEQSPRQASPPVVWGRERGIGQGQCSARMWPA